MIVKYNHATGFMHIHFFEGIPNRQYSTENEDIAKFVSKKNKEQTVGYEIEDFEKNIQYVLGKLALNSKQRLAIAMCYIREKQKKTQLEFSTIIKTNISTYKSIERAEHNISFDLLDTIFNQFRKEEALQKVFCVA